MDLNRMAPIYIETVGTKSGYFELETALQDDNHSEVSANRIGAGENRLDLLRSSVGCHIEIFGSRTTDKIAHAAAGVIGNMTTFPQPSYDAAGRFLHLRRSFGFDRHRRSL